MQTHETVLPARAEGLPVARWGINTPQGAELALKLGGQRHGRCGPGNRCDRHKSKGPSGPRQRVAGGPEGYKRTTRMGERGEGTWDRGLEEGTEAGPGYGDRDRANAGLQKGRGEQ